MLCRSMDMFEYTGGTEELFLQSHSDAGIEGKIYKLSIGLQYIAVFIG